MTTSGIKNYSTRAHRQAATAISARLRKLDTDLKALNRRQELYPAERKAKADELRAQARDDVQGHRNQLADVIAEARREARWVEPTPTGEALTRRLLYATQAQAEFASAHTRNEADAILKTALASSNRERAAEYVRAAAGRVDPVMQRSLALAVAPSEEKMHHAFSRAVTVFEQALPQMDAYIESGLARAGEVPRDASGTPTGDGEALSTRAIDLWTDRVEGQSSKVLSDFAVHQQERAEINLAGVGADPALATASEDA